MNNDTTTIAAVDNLGSGRGGLTSDQVRSAINSVIVAAGKQAAVVANEQEILLAHFDLIHSLNNVPFDNNLVTLKRGHLRFLEERRGGLLRSAQTAAF